MNEPDPASNPDDYVMANKQQLIEIIKHSSDIFVRALALAALVKYGDDPCVDDVVAEIRQMHDIEDDE